MDSLLNTTGNLPWVFMVKNKIWIAFLKAHSCCVRSGIQKGKCALRKQFRRLRQSPGMIEAKGLVSGVNSLMET